MNPLAAKPLSSCVPPIEPRLRVPKICVAIQAETAQQMMDRAQAALADSRFFEFRLDSLADPAAALPGVEGFLAAHTDVTAIATCRRKAFGGRFAEGLTQELAILASAAQAGCRIVDLEVESAEEADAAVFAAFRASLQAAGASLLISFHDFEQTVDIARAADRIAAFAPEFVKVVSTAQSLADNLAVLQLIEERSASAQVVGIAMGEQGLISRVLGPRAGAAFTFAAFSSGEETAPGQVTAQALRALYGVEQLDCATQLFGVAGNPIAHSLSPLMHNAAFRQAGVNAVLLPLQVGALADLLTVVRGLPLAGLAVTMPLKQQVLPHLEAGSSPLARRIGACNTLRVGADGGLAGFNTDVDGVVRPLEKRMSLSGARVAVLGAGGAARAAVFGLLDKGAEVFIVNRTHSTAVALAEEAGAGALAHQEFARRHFDVLINTTPCGMAGSSQPLPIAPDELNAGLVFDMVYNPLETPLLSLARQRGIPVISGLEMFVQQGARQFELWTGKPAPEAEMARVVELELRRRG